MVTRSSQIVGADEPVIGKVKYPIIKLAVDWPGYKVSSIEDVHIMTEGNSIILAMLATQVARQINAIMAKCVSIPCYECAAPFKVEYKKGLTANNVYLVGLKNTVEGVWQVNLDAYIQMPTPSRTAGES